LDPELTFWCVWDCCFNGGKTNAKRVELVQLMKKFVA